jgi:hypothetical protein
LYQKVQNHRAFAIANKETITMTQTLTARQPIWLITIAVLGVAWNLFGLWQYAGSFSQTEASLTAVGMTPAQAAVYLALPVWVSVAFGIGVIGGLIGSILLVLRRAIAVPVFVASLAGYIVLFAADWAYGVFASIPTQLGILAMVVLIAAALLGTAWMARTKGYLRA